MSKSVSLTPSTYALDLDEDFLSHLPRPAAWMVIKGEGIKSDLILDEEVRKIFEWQDDHFRQHGKPATASVLAEEFDIELAEPLTAIGDLLDRLRERFIKNQGRERLKAIGETYKHDPSQVPQMLVSEGRYLSSLLTSHWRSGSVSAADVPLERLRWLWEPWVPLGYLGLVTGASSIGKSLFASWLIGCLSHGGLEGEFQGEPIKTLLVANEDGLADMWGPRLTAAGTDLTKVFHLRYPSDWNIRDGIDLLQTEIARHEAKLVYIDSTLEHLPQTKGSESGYSASFIRSALGPLRSICQENKIAGVISLHPPKGHGSSFASWVAGSAAFVQTTRTGLLFAEHPEDSGLAPQERRRVITSPAESRNVGKDAGSLEFEIRTKTIEIDGYPTQQPYITTPVSSDVTFEDLMYPAEGGESKQTKDAEIKEVVDAYLEDGKWRPALTEDLNTEYALSTIKRATNGYVETKKGASCWWWAKKGTPHGSFREEVEAPDSIPE